MKEEKLLNLLKEKRGNLEEIYALSIQLHEFIDKEDMEAIWENLEKRGVIIKHIDEIDAATEEEGKNFGYELRKFISPWHEEYREILGKIQVEDEKVRKSMENLNQRYAYEMRTSAQTRRNLTAYNDLENASESIYFDKNS